MNTYHYTYLITNLHPTSERKFYVGVHSGPDEPENDRYMGSSKYLNEDIKHQSFNDFEKIIIALFNSRLDAELHEKQLHLAHDAARNPLFYNKKNGVVGFHATKESVQKQQLARNKTINSTIWKETIGDAKKTNLSKTMNNQQWKETIGAACNTKRNKTKSCSDWKGTIGKQQSKKQKETKASKQWKETTGVTQSVNMKERYQNLKWVSSVWESAKKKQSNTKKSAAWIKANTITCPHCQMQMTNRGNFNRYHGSNCKRKN